MPDQTALDQLALMGFAKGLVPSHPVNVPTPAKQLTPLPDTTPLDPEQEQAFQEWAATNAPDLNEDDANYDYRGYWLATHGAPRPEGHLPDTFKQHGHESFSVESQYSRGPQDGGQWLGEGQGAQLIAPPMASHETPDTSVPLAASHLPPNPDGFIGAAPTPLERAQARDRRTAVRAKTPVELLDDRKRELATLPWKETDYTEPMVTFRNMGGMRVPASTVGGLDPTQIMTTEVPGGGGMLERLLPKMDFKRQIHPMGIVSVINAHGAGEEAERRGLMRWLQRKGNTKVSGSEIAAYLERHPVPTPRPILNRTVAGAGIGAAAGATADPEHPVRGAAVGAALGGTMGGLSGRAAVAETLTAHMTEKLAAVEARARAATLPRPYAYGIPQAMFDMPGAHYPTREMVERFEALRTEWQAMNYDLAQHRLAGTENSPAALDLSRRQAENLRAQRAINLDTGGLDGIGLPGGYRDVVVIGAGPGGMTAAIHGASSHLDTLVIDAADKTGGASAYSGGIENLPGFETGITGQKLAETLQRQAARLGADQQMGTRVTSLTYDARTGLKTLTFANGEAVTARSVILATGGEFKELTDVVGADAKGIIYGTQGSIAEAGQHQHVVVIGAGNSAVQAAVSASMTARDVTLLIRGKLGGPTSKMDGTQAGMIEYLRTHSKIHVIEGDQVERFIQDAHGQLTGIVTKGEKELPCDVCGVFISSEPKTEWLPKEIQRDARGKILTRANFETDIPGVFAIGDVRANPAPDASSISTAIGEGKQSSTSVHDYFARLRKTQVKE